MHPRCAVCAPGPALGIALGPALERLEVASRLHVPVSGDVQRVSADGELQNVSLGVRTAKKNVMLVTAEVAGLDDAGNPVFEFRIEVPPYERRPAYICHPSALEPVPGVPDEFRVRDGGPIINIGRAYPRAEALALLEPFVDPALGLVWCRHPRIPGDWTAAENRRRRRR